MRERLRFPAFAKQTAVGRGCGETSEGAERGVERAARFGRVCVQQDFGGFGFEGVEEVDGFDTCQVRKVRSVVG